MASFDREKEIAFECLGALPRRWAHVNAVGRAAEALAETAGLSEIVVRAAWLHDVGYGPSINDTEFHPLDGARYLASLGFEEQVVRLVAHHTGARFEAEQRGLLDELSEIPEPDQDLLDQVTMVDLATSPDGEAIRDVDRIDEILSRYEPTHPVHHAVTKSRASLLASSARGKKLLGLSDEWPFQA